MDSADPLEGLKNLTAGATDPPFEVPDSSRVETSVVLYGTLVAISLSLYSVVRKMWPNVMMPRLNRQMFGGGLLYPFRSPPATNAQSSAGTEAGGISGNAAMYSSTSRITEGAGDSRPFWSLCLLWEIDLSWSWKALAFQEKHLIRQCGMDGYILIRVVRFCWTLMAGYCLAATIMLFPVYYTSEIRDECIDICNLPVDPGGSWDNEASCICGPIDRASVATIRSSSHELWTPIVVLYILTTGTLYACKREYQKFLQIQAYCWHEQPQAYTVLVEHLPEKLRERSGEKVREYFNRMFPEQIISVDMVDAGSKAFSSLCEIGTERNYVVWQLERMSALRQSNQIRQGKPFSVGCWPGLLGLSSCCLKARDGEGGSSSAPTEDRIKELENSLEILNRRFAFVKHAYLLDIPELLPSPSNLQTLHAGGRRDDFFRDKLVEENEDALEKDPEQAIAQDESFLGTESLSSMALDDISETTHYSAAFVTFRNLVASSLASQSQIDDKSSMRVVSAPQPLDVSWDHLGLSGSARALRRAITKSCFYLILLFWGVLTSVVGASTSTKALARQFPTLRMLVVEHPELARYLDQFAPLVLVILVGTVNPLMGIMARFEGRISESAADKRAMERYFAFLVVQVFLFYSVAGTVFKTFVEIIQQPSKIANTLGSTIPKNAAFYIQFIIVKLFWMLSFELLRVSNIILACLRRIVAGTPVTWREQISMFCGCFELKYPSPISIPSTLAQILLVYFIAIVYAVIQPLVLPAAFVFFSFANVVYTTVLTTSAKVMYDSGGHFWWQSAYRCITIGLVTAQLTLIGVLLIKEGYRQAILAYALPFITAFVSYKIDTRFTAITTTLPVHLAAKIDEERGMQTIKQVIPPVWQYGAIRPGYQPTATNESTIVFTYRHPVLFESDKAVPNVYNLLAQTSPMEVTTTYGTMSNTPPITPSPVLSTNSKPPSQADCPELVSSLN